ncbi:MAG TPA: ABC transporter substrate-binding protein [Methylomirabilota bacterium]|jgi:putative ABC transport system substrate-binding protein|nr:ABC transporter substrate-binding protein [Methylomirabilota bacterium]
MKSTTAALLAGLAALALFVSAPRADAQQAAAPRRIGILESGWAPAAPARESLIEVLGAIGWVEGQNLVVERRYAQDRYNRLAMLATEMLQAKVDVLVPLGADAARAARQVTATVPIVFVAVPSPAQILPIRSFAKPGGNVTGSSFDLPQSEFAKLPRLLHEVAPQVFRQGVLWDPTSPGMSQAVLAAYYSQEEARLNFRAFEIRSAPDLEMAFEKIRAERVRAVFILPSPAAVTYRARIVDFMTKNQIPALYPSREFVEAGGLMAYGPSMPDAQGQAATLVDQILKGASPGDLPIRVPVRFQPVINLRAARAIELTLPQSLLDRSEKIGE